MERVNLLPWRENVYTRRRRQTIWSSGVMLLLLAGLLGKTINTYRQQQTRWAIQAVQIQQQARVLQQHHHYLVTQIEKTEACLAQQQRWYQRQFQGQRRYQLLRSIQQHIPQNVWLTAVILENQTLLVQGGGMQAEEIETFADTLRHYSASSRVNRLVQAQQAQWYFSLQIPWSDEGA